MTKRNVGRLETLSSNGVGDRMKPPTHKNLIDTDVAIKRGGPRVYVTSVSVEDYEAALCCVQYWRERAEYWYERAAAGKGLV
jgi:uncharacterized protein YodC (DUF2158 family)